MSWNPDQGHTPNQPGQYGGAAPTPVTDPYTSQQGGYQQSGYQQSGEYQQAEYQTPYGASATAARPNANGPTSMGMDANIAAGLSYSVGWITGLIFFFLERQNRFVRFHAMQSILFSVVLTVFYVVLNIVSFALAITGIPFIGLLFTFAGFLVSLGALAVWIFLLINAFQGRYFKLPVLGAYAERYANPTR